MAILGAMASAFGGCGKADLGAATLALMNWKYFNHWRKLRRLQSEMDEISRAYRRERPKDKVSPEKRRELLEAEASEIYCVVDQINREVTQYWVHKANSLMLPVADRSDENCWKDDWELTPTYLATLRSSVRKEKKER